MERAIKRPRLSLFRSSPTGDEFDRARLNNDRDLKHRFESIFTKYALDFSGIGDEIDIITGEVVVNNGHLESMESETDSGIEHVPGGFASAGRSMLRAMTVTLDSDMPGPDDVLASIEPIAENAAFADEEQMDESETTSLYSRRTLTSSRSRSRSYRVKQSWPDDIIEPNDPDADSLFAETQARYESPDSLFAEEQARYESPDSLFEVKQNCETTRFQDAANACLLTNETDLAAQSMHGTEQDKDIIARFGPDVGKEILDLIGKRQEAHIEPAWRIPVQLNQISHRSHTPQISSQSTEFSPDSRQYKSLWTLPTFSRRSHSPIGSTGHGLREESIDPLQDDFQDGEEDTECQPQTNSVSDLMSTAPANQVKFDKDGFDQGLSRYTCHFCKIDFGRKHMLMAHWDRLLQQPEELFSEDDPHNLDVMRKIRSQNFVCLRGPRLTLCDFRTMVELHEGAGISFDQISVSRTLRTRKTGLQLQSIYDKHRTPPMQSDGFITRAPWIESEKHTLQELCQNPLVTMATLRRVLKSRDDLDIGDYLADMWLGQLKAVRDDPKIPLQTTRDSDAGHPRSVITGAADHSLEPRTMVDGTEVKQEGAED